jgi:hypothetical protein
MFPFSFPFPFSIVFPLSPLPSLAVVIRLDTSVFRLSVSCLAPALDPLSVPCFIFDLCYALWLNPLRAGSVLGNFHLS